MKKFSTWEEHHNWIELYKCEGIDRKVQIFQDTLVKKYEECFPVTTLKISCEDKPWITADLKKLDRKRKREFSRHFKSEHWKRLNKEFLEKCNVTPSRKSMMRSRQEMLVMMGSKKS